ncbi:Prolyl 4-hydroxylase [Sphingomonas antarctica]|uniref:2OG-Fe(II) oxygenase n=1 Tax=Sphingomonas antarctica TaxID=2040274 RepID=UPI0039E7A8EE
MRRFSPELQQALALADAGRVAEGALIVHRQVAAGDPDALFILADWKWSGVLPQDPVEARQLYRRAGDMGNVEAAAYSTNLLGNGVAGPRDWTAAVARLENEAKRDPARRKAFELIGRMKLDADGDPLTLPEGEILSTSPRVTKFERLFTAGECDYLRAAAEANYQPSTVYNAQRQLVRDAMRGSDGATFHWLIEDPAVHALNRRLAAVSGSDAEHGEALQILRYRPGQQYKPHFDFVRAAKNQRRLTALVYLNHDYEGGETAFVKTGLKVKGRKGDVVVFANALPDRAVDPLSEHAGLPVKRGTKYLGSRWIRESRWHP